MFATLMNVLNTFIYIYYILLYIKKGSKQAGFDPVGKRRKPQIVGITAGKFRKINSLSPSKRKYYSTKNPLLCEQISGNLCRIVVRICVQFVCNYIGLLHE